MIMLRIESIVQAAVDELMEQLKSGPEKPVTIALCGPNRTCDHAMDHYVDLVDGERVCGTTLACSKCGETSFNLSLWN